MEVRRPRVVGIVNISTGPTTDFTTTPPVIAQNVMQCNRGKMGSGPHCFRSEMDINLDETLEQLVPIFAIIGLVILGVVWGSLYYSLKVKALCMTDTQCECVYGDNYDQVD